MAKNLISLIDGTMVSAAQTDDYKGYSNVFELACLLQLMDKSWSPQIVFYTSGISSQPDNINLFNLATGKTIKSQIIDQYTNICANFDFDAVKDQRPQDRIFLFGFSRGAMAVRALAGLIAEFGLLHPKDIRYLPKILDAWDKTLGRGSVPGFIRLYPAEIEFVGVFDSVMGGIERMRMFNPIRFSNAWVPPRVRSAIQILAIDENRSFFKPKQWERTVDGRDNTGKNTKPFLRQIWMPGVHSDIGGTGEPLWGCASLLAMTYYIEKITNLRLNQKWLRRREANLRESFDGPFHIRPHRGLFSSHVRQPDPAECARERSHPICDELGHVNYDRRKFDWGEEVFGRHFSKLTTDPDLADYFRDVLSGSERKRAGEAQRPATGARPVAPVASQPEAV